MPELRAEVLPAIGYQPSQQPVFQIKKSESLVYETSDVEATARETSVLVKAKADPLVIELSTTAKQLRLASKTGDSIRLQYTDNWAAAKYELSPRWRVNIGTNQLALAYTIPSKGIQTEAGARCLANSLNVTLDYEPLNEAEQTKAFTLGQQCLTHYYIDMQGNNLGAIVAASAQQSLQAQLNFADQYLNFWRYQTTTQPQQHKANTLELGISPQTLNWQGVRFAGAARGLGYFASYHELQYSGSASIEAQNKQIANLAGGKYLLLNTLDIAAYELGFSSTLSFHQLKFTPQLSYIHISGKGTASLYRNLLLLPIPVLRERISLPEVNEALFAELSVGWQGQSGALTFDVSQVVPINSNESAGNGGGSILAENPNVKGGTTFSMTGELYL